MYRVYWVLIIIAFLFPATLRARVKLGNEVLVSRGFKELQGKRIGLICNPSGVNGELVSTIDVLRKAPGVNLVALFGPEHGIYGDIPAGDKVATRVDKRTGLTVHSLYGDKPEKKKPSQEMLKGLDALVYDLQDTGCRSYTFVSTMGLAMEACGEAGIEFIVLDRPNPLGGDRVEGPLLGDEKFRSFVSQWDVPYVYGMTCGELAQMINGEKWIKKPCKLTVVPLADWKRSMVWADTGLQWVPTSPHVPQQESPLFQVATGMLGELGGKVSIGIGYTLPFQTIAHPSFEAHKTADLLNSYQIEGVKFVPLTYTPYYGPFVGKRVAGAQLYFLEPQRAPLTAINIYLAEAVMKLGGVKLFDPTIKPKKGVDPIDKASRAEANLKALKIKKPAKPPKKVGPFDMFDKVNGTDATRKELQAGTAASSIINSWKAGEEAFKKSRAKYLLY